MKENTRRGLAWSVSLLTHALLLLLVFPNGGGSRGEDQRIMEVGLVEMPGVAPRIAPVARPAPSIKVKPLEKVRRESVPDREGQDKPQPRETAAKQTVSVPASPPKGPSGTAGPAAGVSPGQGSGEGFGTGEGLVLSRPVNFPKNAQNEGVEGSIRLAVFLTPTGSVRAKILESSGDQRLDAYSLRVVTEAWRYAATSAGVRIAVTLNYRKGRVEVVFERGEPWNGEGFER